MTYLVLEFRRDNDSGIARVDIYDNTAGEYLVQNQTIDLYTSQFTALAGRYETFLARYTIDPAHEYSIDVSDTRTHNIRAAGPNYAVRYIGSYTEQSEESYTSKVLYLTDSENDLEYSYPLLNDTIISLERNVVLSGDGTTRVFHIGSSIKAKEFLSFTMGEDLTYSPTSLNINWGSNYPAYDNETITEGEFWVEFASAPAEGIYPEINIIPVFDKARVEINLVEAGSPISLQQIGIKFTK